MSEITRLINAMDAGDPRAAQQLLPLIYEELRKMARQRMAGERAAHTLDATALVHEAYLRLIGVESHNSPLHWKGRAHFFGAAAEAMRRILIEHARRRNSLKRGGGRIESLTGEAEDLPAIQAPCAAFDDLLALDQALEQLAAEHPQKAELIKLLYFAGLDLQEAGAVLGISAPTAHRHALFARAWLHDVMKSCGG